MDQQPVTKKGRGRPRRAGGRLPTLTFRVSKGARYYLDAIKQLFPDENQSSLLRTVWDLAVRFDRELEAEIKVGYEDRGALGTFRSAIGLSVLSTSFPSAKGVVTFRVEPEQQTQYEAVIGQRNKTLAFEAALRLFHKKATKHRSPATGQ